MAHSSDFDTEALDFDPVPDFHARIPIFNSPPSSPLWFSDSDSDYGPGSEYDSDRDSNFFVTDLFAPTRRNHVLEPQNDLSLMGFRGRAETGSYEVPEFRAAAGVVDPLGSRNEGLRVTGFDSDSDYEDGIPGFGVMNLVDSSSDDGDGMVPVDDSDLRLPWEGFGSGDLRAPNEDEWEEVDERVVEREGLGVLDVIEELSESSEISAEEDDDDPTMEAIRNLEWEILLAVNTLERDSILDPGDLDSYLAVHDDDFGQFEEIESALKGSPPAAKTVVENLPLVELRKEDIGVNNLVCAVCKDDVLCEEKVRKLPCCHYYHQDCILPWLSIRNTCPVCRYELATDDAEYERRKAQRAGHGLARDSQVRFNFELFA